MNKHAAPPFRPLQLALLLGGALVFSPSALPAPTDLANGPLANGVSAATSVKPNVAFIVDDSGSMEDENMPDDDGTNKSKRCWGWHNYNTLAYNPAVTYKPPYLVGGTTYADGVTRFADASFTAAKKDGYFSIPGYTYEGNSTSNRTVDLSATANLTTAATSKYYYTSPTAAANNGKTTCLNDSDYTAVTSANNIAAPGVANGSAAAKTNYANWYSFYRKRAYMMKAATSEAFSDLSDQYRVGLFYLSSQQSGVSDAGPNNDLAIADFSGTQRTDFFTSLQANRSAGWTPLRGALARIGRMYAGKIANWDPVQYSCQQNFTILSTDGYWNSNTETSTYGPYKLDGNRIGNADGGPIPATPSTATITFGNESACTHASNITANLGSGAIQLLDAAAVPNRCTTNRRTLGSAIESSINNRTGTTGFSASWSSPTLTITAPVSAGALTSTPTVTLVNTGGSRTITTTAFNGFVEGSATSASLPYRDALNKENTLADVAYYYYTTDLRTAALGNCSNTIGATTYNNLCDNNVAGAGKDVNQQQHMTTFTIGLGANGTLLYEPNYETAQKDSNASTTQYHDIANGTANWPDPIANTSGERIDDLWHAAVNGRGTYYSAANSNTLSSGIRSALAGVATRTGSSAAAATSNLEPVDGDNFVYVALYRTTAWDGDLKAYAIDPNTGAISTTSANWSGQAQLDAQVSAAGANADGRTIKYFNGNAANKLKDFTYTNLNADGIGASFDSFCTKNPTPDQCGTDINDLDATKKTLANSGDNLVKYLRGQSTYEDKNNNDNALYRGRDHILGDIINAVPVYSQKPVFTYDKYDTTYATFKSNNLDRPGTTFVAANDGMLHAFNADTGNERWAYVPSFVMPNMWRLADHAYSTNHRYFVDGSPTVADVCSTSTLASGCAAAADWKTIIVGGLNKGGCGYYALDVTDPTSPKGLWEFSHEQLGYSYGNPIVTRRGDGKWVVIFASGYNNIAGSGCASSTANSDGNGHVFVLDALTGTLLESIPTYTSGTTPAGTPSTPSGLAKLNVWLDDGDLNIASRIYGGDLLGNLWRIDYDDKYNASGKEAMRLAQLVTSAGIAQPVTTKPELNTVKSLGVTYDLVLVATGKYLGTSDPADTSQNTIYALKDQLNNTPISDVRGSSMLSRTLAQLTNAAGQNIRTISGTGIDWASKDGWYIDLNPNNLSPGERVNTNMQLYFNSLIVPANVPDSNVCNIGGFAWLYFIDITRGLNLLSATDAMAGLRLDGNALVAGIKTVKLTNGKTVTIVTDTGGGITSIANPSGGGTAKIWRTTWREIPN